MCYIGYTSIAKAITCPTWLYVLPHMANKVLEDHS